MKYAIRLVLCVYPNILLDRGNSCQFLAKSRMTLLNEIFDSSCLVCVFSPIFYWIAAILCQILAKSRMTLWRERARGREARVQSEESCSRGGRGTEAGRNTAVFW